MTVRTPRRDFAVNRRATFEYFIDERLEAGLMLEGWEVKTIRERGLSLDGAFVQLRDGSVVLTGAHVEPLPTVTGHVQPEPRRTRALLLHKREIARLVGTVERKGMTLVPLRVYDRAGHIKVEVGVARGKKLHDKRDALKERAIQREAGRELAR